MALLAAGQAIVEMKFEKVLPSILKQLISQLELTSVSHSKYRRAIKTLGLAVSIDEFKESLVDSPTIILPSGLGQLANARVVTRTMGHGRPVAVIAKLGLAIFFGWIVAQIYRLARRNARLTPSLPATLTMLPVLIAVVTLVIGDNQARAFSLVGALSIVRFRTVVEDTHDIVFVIFAVAVGMAVGADRLWIAVASLVVIGSAAVYFRPRLNIVEHAKQAIRMIFRVGLAVDAENVLSNELARFADTISLVSCSTSQKGASLELSYLVTLKPQTSIPDMVRQLNQVPQVQQVEVAMD